MNTCTHRKYTTIRAHIANIQQYMHTQHIYNNTNTISKIPKHESSLTIIIIDYYSLYRAY